jgi:flagellar basal-body rod protein FlgB
MIQPDIFPAANRVSSMIDKLDRALGFHQEALNLRHERQKVLASNIANADTPNYKARDLDFAKELSRVTQQQPGVRVEQTLATTSAQHIKPAVGSGAGKLDLLYRVPTQPSLDGNTVDMDTERAQFTDNAVRYQASLVLLNSRIQSLKSAMQPE